MQSLVNELIRSGEVRRLSRGVYIYCGKPAPRLQKQEIMWRFLRMERSLTIEDLQEAAEVSADYAREWLRHLVDRGIVRDHGNGNYQLVKDSLEMPRNGEKAEKLRRIRERKKIALEALRSARASLDRAECLIEGMELEGEEPQEEACHAAATDRQ